MMLKFITIAFFLTVCFVVNAQDIDPLKLKADTLLHHQELPQIIPQSIDTLKLKVLDSIPSTKTKLPTTISKLDSIKAKQRRLDTKWDSLRNVSVHKFPDSTRTKYQAIIDKKWDKVDSIAVAKSAWIKDKREKIFSGKNGEQLSDTTSAVDSLVFSKKSEILSKFSKKISDSIQHPFHSKVKYSQKVSKADSLQEISSGKVGNSLGKLEIQSKKINDIKTPKVNIGTEKSPNTDAINELGDKADIDIPNLSTDKVKRLPGINSNQPLPTNKTPNISKMPELPSMDKVKNKTQDLGISQVGTEGDNLKKIKKVKAPQIKKIGNIKLGELDQAQKYSKELSKGKEKAGKIKNLKTEDWQSEEVKKKAENKLKKLSKSDEIEKHTAKLEETRTLPDRYKKQMEQYQDKERYKDNVRDKYKQIGANHFHGKEEQLKTSIESLGKYKLHYDEVEDVKKLPKIKPNTMKGKTVGERVVVGSNFQIHTSPRVGLGIFPQIGYKLSGRFTWGVGATYRLYFEKKTTAKGVDDNAFGWRTYLNTHIYKGFYVHVAYESINTTVKNSKTPSIDNKQWVSNILVGIEKQYGISRGIKGNVQILYNFSHVLGKTPYSSSLVFRFGIEGVFHKKHQYQQKQ